MQIEVITIGAELLSGRVVDTNFAYIAKRLSEEGWTVFQHISIPDEKKRIEESVQQALKRSSIIFTTGGLGPTLDDCTKKVLAQLFGKTLQPSLAIRQDLVERFGQELASLEEQSTVPGETVLLRNKVGTAPGFLFEKDRKQVFVLPGVPLEMISMFEEEVLPKLRESMTQR
ncbi:MAG: competence/damage-inducible protein A, partial [Chlamydiae bacterium]|nr:competence/damage-inducible protein A [Chlamydiota bacterium]